VSPRAAAARFQEVVGVGGIVVVGGAAVWYYSISPYFSRILALIGLAVVVACGLNLLTGVAGQLSLGHAGFYAVGAYTTALLTVRHGWPMLPTVPVAAVLCAALGAVMAASALRVRGPYLAMVTIAFGLIVHDVAVEFPEWTGGPAGVSPVPAPAVGAELTLTQVNAVILVLVALAVYTTSSLIRSRFGRALRAVHGNDLAAASAGIPVVRMKRLAFVLSAVYAGVAGAFFAPVNSFVNPDPFTLELSILFLVMVIIGGTGTVWGPVLGAVALTLLDRSLSGIADYRLIVYGGVLLLALYVVPDGVAGTVRRLVRRLRRRAGPLPAAAPVELRPTWDAVAAGEPLLRVESVSRHFAGLRALDDVSFDVHPGSVHAIVGPNGAGKTTVLNLVSGVDVPTSGRVVLAGEPLSGRSVHAVAADGVSRTFQNLALFADLTALDNVLIGLHLRTRVRLAQALVRSRAVYREEDELRAEAMGLLEFVGLADAALSRAGDLPQGHQRMLEVARALASRPRLLLLDEPAAGLNGTEVDELGRLITRVRDAGVTVLLIEHHMDLVLTVCDRVTVLDYGRVISEGSPAEVQRDKAVVEAYLGPSDVITLDGKEAARA
jgi:branched-chain amino acid transport system permease protein